MDAPRNPRRRARRPLLAAATGLVMALSMSGCQFLGADFVQILACMGGSQDACRDLAGGFRSPDGGTGPEGSGPGIGRAAAGRAVVAFTTTADKPGTLVFRSGRLTASAARTSGAFSAALRGRRSALGRRARGTWRAAYAWTINARTHKGTADGLLLMKFAKGKGRSCLAFHTRYAVATRNRLVVRGTFRALGGSGPARRVSFSGSYTSARDSAGRWTLRGASAGRPRKAKALPARCRSI